FDPWCEHGPAGDSSLRIALRKLCSWSRFPRRLENALQSRLGARDFAQKALSFQEKFRHADRGSVYHDRPQQSAIRLVPRAWQRPESVARFARAALRGLLQKNIFWQMLRLSPLLERCFPNPAR